jgi:hypothetical protein
MKKNMKAMKVFYVETAIMVDGKEAEHWSDYNVLGQTVEDAIAAAKTLMVKGEYILSVEHKMTLD